MGRRNRPKREGKTTKKRRVRERRADRRAAWERLRAKVTRAARLSADQLARGLSADDLVKLEAQRQDKNRWRNYQIGTLATDEGVVERARVSESRPMASAWADVPTGQPGLTARRFVRRWKKLKTREIERLLELTWEPNKEKDIVSALGDVARGYHG